MPCHHDDPPRSPFVRATRYTVLHVPPVVLSQPWALFVKLACAVGGALVLLGIAPEPPSVANVLPGVFAHLWALMLCLGGVLGLVGLLRDYWRIECAGLLFLWAAALAYAILLARNFGAAGTVPMAGFLGLSVAALFRAAGVAAAHLLADHRIADAIHEANHHPPFPGPTPGPAA